MLKFRLKALDKFNELDNPTFGPKLNIDFDKITYYKEKGKILLMIGIRFLRIFVERFVIWVL